MLRRVEHEKWFITSGPGQTIDAHADGYADPSLSWAHMSEEARFHVAHYNVKAKVK